ncbi:unnamed protein product [Acanthoscelides obtectus]|uniref:Uncharacterized protein n=1 Tax=Acanthoscelides obtectus TaxID=200917 RepID=A0A9P0P611_ACAOB|nr:unnamed protein product [Acanthoscelides obtectus]CAK1657551.1 hypothetical protein AOBTE_LOCUS20413 [Acanthoscelides obtectus]
MDTVSGIIYVVVVVIVLIMMMVLLRIRFKEKKILRDADAQQDRVYSISERVQPNEWSSRDAYLTVQHITAENQMNKPNYNDAPPSYEEAMRIVALTTATGESSTVVTVSTLPKEPN